MSNFQKSQSLPFRMSIPRPVYSFSHGSRFDSKPRLNLYNYHLSLDATNIIIFLLCETAEQLISVMELEWTLLDITVVLLLILTDFLQILIKQPKNHFLLELEEIPTQKFI